MKRIVPLLLMLFVSPVFAANTPQAADAEKAVTKKKLSVAHIELSGSYPEGAGAPGLFGDVVETLPSTLIRLEKAGKDDDLTAIILHINGPTIGWAKLHELRTGIQKMRQKGRKVYAWLESADKSSSLPAFSRRISVEGSVSTTSPNKPGAPAPSG